MKKKPVYAAFSTQKGGAGKTTLTVLTASYLHYLENRNVAVIDCDYPQYSIAESRRRDIKLATDDKYYKALAYEQFTRIGKKMYPVVTSTPDQAIETADMLAGKGDYDFIFFDLPGTVNNSGVVTTLSQMDYIFSPISADRIVLESTLRFAVVMTDNVITTGKSRIKGLHLLWNLVDGREKSELYDVYEKVIGELNLNLMKTFLPDSKRFRRELTSSHKEIFRSTMFPADRPQIRGSNLDTLVEEMLEIMK